MAEKLRLQKYMSQSGVCSRRKAEEYIERGWVKVNGQKVEVGCQIDPNVDSVEFNKALVKDQKNLVYYVVNKPRGVVTTCKSYKEKAIVDIIDVGQRVFPIGRLDKETTGLILLTNDGRLTNYLIHPRYNHEKEYVVETFGPITDRALQKMTDGIFILGSYTKKAKVKRIASGKFSIVLTEGRNRQIRRMVEKVGLQVKKLKRVRIENIQLGKLGLGEYRELSLSEKNKLFKKLGL